MKKIVHIQLLPLLSGVQNVMLNILQNLDQNEYEIYVLSKPDGPLVEKVIELGYKHIPMSSFRREISFLDIVSFISLIRLFKKYKFDIVHTHSSKSGFLGRIAARIAGIPKILHTVHGFPFHPYQPKLVSSIYKTLEKFAAYFCDKIVFVNNSDREKAIKSNLVKTEKAVTIFNGVELPKINLELNTAKDHLTIGSSFRFWQQKNVINTIQAAIRVCRRNDKIEFIFVGDGELCKSAKRTVYESGLQNRILLPGWQKDISQWLKKFDIFLLYSRWEGLPLSILEAMAFGLPIIASDINGNNELVDETNGVLVPIDSETELVDVILDLVDKKEILKEMGNSSRKIINEKFNMKQFHSKYQEIYED